MDNCLILYHIAWHIDDPKTWLNFAQVSTVTAAANRYWQKVKQTEFATYHPKARGTILPNGEFHGPRVNDTSDDTPSAYFIRGFAIYPLHWRDFYFTLHQSRIIIMGRSSCGIFSSDETIGIRNCPLCDKICYYSGDKNRLRIKHSLVDEKCSACVNFLTH